MTLYFSILPTTLRNECVCMLEGGVRNYDSNDSIKGKFIFRKALEFKRRTYIEAAFFIFMYIKKFVEI